MRPYRANSIKCTIWLWHSILLAALLARSAHSEGPVIQTGPSAPVAQTIQFGPLVQGPAGMPPSISLPFRLPVSSAVAAAGYRITAYSTFVFTPRVSVAGGKTLAASDIGVGIINVISPPGTGSAAIVGGFDYDPGAVTRPYAGATAGQATLADVSSGRDIMQVGKVSKASQGDLSVTVKIAVPMQYFTPGSFTGSMTLAVIR